MKTLLRMIQWLVLGFVAMALAARASGGWVVTPLVYAYPSSDLEYARSELEYLGDVIVAATADGVDLVGVHVASDEGAPVVLHLLESGVSVAEGIAPREAFWDLSRAGYASVAFDYRGVGVSGGEVDATALLRDAEAMWDQAVELAGGDPSHVILRGCSLGSIVVTMLLEAGHRPGAIIAVAPVEATTVGPRYGKLFVWPPVVWLAQPFLRPVTKASTVETLASAGVPVFAHVHPDDMLLSDPEFVRWLELGAQAGRASVAPLRVLVHEELELEYEASVPGLSVHLNLAMQSYRLSGEEQAFLASSLPWYRPQERRIEALIARADPSLAAEVADRPEAYRRAQSLAAELPDAPANAVLVAALQLTDDEFAAAHHWIRGPWKSGPGVILFCLDDESSPPGPANLPLEDLREIFNLQYEEGRLPIQALLSAREELYCHPPQKSGRAWTLARLQTLSAALGRGMSHPNVFIEAELDAETGPEWHSTPERDHVLILTRFEEGVGVRLELIGASTYVKPVYWMDPIAHALGLPACEGRPSWEVWDDSAIDLLVRCIRQATWVTE